MLNRASLTSMLNRASNDYCYSRLICIYRCAEQVRQFVSGGACGCVPNVPWEKGPHCAADRGRHNRRPNVGRGQSSACVPDSVSSAHGLNSDAPSYTGHPCFLPLAPRICGDGHCRGVRQTFLSPGSGTGERCGAADE